MSDHYSVLKNACAYVKTDVGRGTAYLVARDMAVTCEHVIRGSHRVTLQFEKGGPVEATVIKVNDIADCALLKLAAPLDIQPLRYANLCKRNDPWEAYGFPEQASESGVPLTGDIRDPEGKDPVSNDAIILYSREFSSGSGAQPQGFSGTPVFVNGFVVGHLKRILTSLHSNSSERPRTEMGIVYACPSRFIIEMSEYSQASRSAAASAVDPNLYIPRALEERFAVSYVDELGVPAVLWGPVLLGKTTLLKQLLSRFNENVAVPRKIVNINLGVIDPEIAKSLELLLKRMASTIIHELGGHPETVDSLWGKFMGSPIDRMNALMQEHILPMVNGQLVLAIDKADAVWKWDFKDRFYVMLRSWISGGVSDISDRLRLLLAISIDPYWLISEENTSPFNISEPIYVEDFDDSQIVELANRFGLDWGANQIEKLRGTVGGHPYLLRLIMLNARIADRRLDHLLDFKNPQNRIFDNYLNRYNFYMKRDSNIADELRRFKGSMPQVSQNKELCERLVAVGLLMREAGYDEYRLRYKLYERLIG